jgi:response regulator NasT
MDKPLNIALADDDPRDRDHLLGLLTRLGHRAVAAAAGRELVELCRADPPDLVLAEVELPQLDGIQAAEAICLHREVPVIVVSGRADAEVVRRTVVDHIMAYLIKPVTEAKLNAAIHVAVARFRQYLRVRREAEGLWQALADRKVVEAAKGVLIRRLGVYEEEAYRRLSKRASDTGRKLVGVAREVLEAEEVFRGMDE